MTDTSFPILGLDYGTVRLGLAIARTGIAEPYQILIMSDQVFNQIAEICQTEQVKLIVVGESEGAMAQQSRLFGQKVQTWCQLPVIYSDETLSSHDSQAKLRQIGKKDKYIDQYAACEMLQAYVDTMGVNHVEQN